MSETLKTLTFKDLRRKTFFKLAIRIYLAAFLFNCFYSYTCYSDGLMPSFYFTLLPAIGFISSVYLLVVKRNYLAGPYLIFIFLGIASICLSYLEGLMSGYYWFQFSLLFSLPYLLRREVHPIKHTYILYALIFFCLIVTFLIAPIYSEYYLKLGKEQMHNRFILNSSVNFLFIMIFSLQALSHNKSVTSKMFTDKENAEGEKERRTRVLSNLGHELRTQVNSINGVTQLILNEDSTELQNKKYFEILDYCNKNMLFLVNDMLDMHKIESGHFELSKEPKVLYDFLVKITTPFINKAEEKNLELYSYIDPKLIGLVLDVDEKRIAQVVYNLISNAIKFTEQGRITFSAEVLNLTISNVKIRFIVNDTGIGIAPKNLNKVFESFHQVKNENIPIYGGTGLGLSISQSIVKAMNSIITIESVLNKGTRFQFSLDLKRTTLHSVTNKADDIFTDDFMLNLSILLVEDNMVSMMYAKKLLSNHVEKIYEATNGIEAIDSVKANNDINLVLLDLEMPKMNGFKAIRHIKRLRPKLTVIAFTANIPSTEIVTKLDSLGFDDILSKPFNKQELFSVLKKYKADDMK